MVVYYMNGECYYDVAVFIGFFAGIFFTSFFFVFMKYADRFKLKQYYRMIDDKGKKELGDTLKNIDHEFDVLAVNTNTSWMKRASNDIKNIINYLRKKDVN